VRESVDEGLLGDSPGFDGDMPSPACALRVIISGFTIVVSAMNFGIRVSFGRAIPFVSSSSSLPSVRALQLSPVF
jgi:hypothetical protein